MYGIPCKAGRAADIESQASSDYPFLMSRIHQSTTTYRILAFICGLCLLFILLLTAAETLCFRLPDWWRNEYAKYDTPSNVNGEMSLDDAVHVTEDMLEYCMGRLDTLDDTEATIDGVTQPFFTDREKAHLADCRALFQKAIRARVIALLLLIAFVIYIFVHNEKREAAKLLARGYLHSLVSVLALSAVIAVLCAIDFTWVFTEFHHIFFDNDLWILYPERDNLINIMQEDVFFDAAKCIAAMWLGAAAVLAAVSVFVLRKQAPDA